MTHQFKLCDDGTMVGIINGAAMVLPAKDDAEIIKFADVMIGLRPCAGNPDKRFDDFITRDSIYSPDCLGIVDKYAAIVSGVTTCVKCQNHRATMHEKINWMKQAKETPTHVGAFLASLSHQNLLKRAIKLFKEITTLEDVIKKLRVQLEEVNTQPTFIPILDLPLLTTLHQQVTPAGLHMSAVHMYYASLLHNIVQLRLAAAIKPT